MKHKYIETKTGIKITAVEASWFAGEIIENKSTEHPNLDWVSVKLKAKRLFILTCEEDWKIPEVLKTLREGFGPVAYFGDYIAQTEVGEIFVISPEEFARDFEPANAKA